MLLDMNLCSTRKQKEIMGICSLYSQSHAMCRYSLYFFDKCKNIVYSTCQTVLHFRPEGSQ